MYIYIYITLQYITFHYIPLHYITLHCIALHCIALHSESMCETSKVERKYRSPFWVILRWARKTAACLMPKCPLGRLGLSFLRDNVERKTQQFPELQATHSPNMHIIQVTSSNIWNMPIYANAVAASQIVLEVLNQHFARRNSHIPANLVIYPCTLNL